MRERHWPGSMSWAPLTLDVDFQGKDTGSAGRHKIQTDQILPKSGPISHQVSYSF